MGQKSRLPDTPASIQGDELRTWALADLLQPSQFFFTINKHKLLIQYITEHVNSYLIHSGQEAFPSYLASR
jgi:hypothetical protein